MSSLKGYIPGLARILKMTPDALYERQRALTRAGLFRIDDVKGGRGPGSGARASSYSVTVLLLSVLAAERLTEVPQRVLAIADAHPTRGKKCPYTGMKTFLDAFAKVLTGRGRAMEITVSRTADRAQIKFFRHASRSVEASEFAGRAATEPGLSVIATLNQDLLLQIEADVREIEADVRAMVSQPAGDAER